MDFKMCIENSPLMGNIISMMVMITVIVSPVVILKILFEFLYSFYGLWHGMSHHVKQLMRGRSEPVHDYPKFQTERMGNGTVKSDGLVHRPSHVAVHQSDHITTLQGCSIIGLVNGSSFLPSLRKMLQQARSNLNIPYKGSYLHSEIKDSLNAKLKMEKEIQAEEPVKKIYSSQIVIGNYDCHVSSVKAGIYHVSCKYSTSSNRKQTCCNIHSSGNGQNGFNQTTDSTSSVLYCEPLKSSVDDMTTVDPVNSTVHSRHRVLPLNMSGTDNRSLTIEVKLRPKMDSKLSASGVSMTLNGGMTYEILTAKLLKVDGRLSPGKQPLVLPSGVGSPTNTSKCPLNGLTEHKNRTIERRDSEGDDFIVFCDVTIEGQEKGCHDQESLEEVCWSDSGDESDDEDSGSSDDESSDDEYESESGSDEVGTRSAKGANQPGYGCRLMRNVFENFCWTGDSVEEDRTACDFGGYSTDDSVAESEDSDEGDDEDNEAPEEEDSSDHCQFMTEAFAIDEVDNLRVDNVDLSKGGNSKQGFTEDPFCTQFPDNIGMQDSKILHTDLSLTTFRSCTGTLISFRHPFITEQCLKTSFSLSDQEHSPKVQRSNTKRKTVTFAPADELATIHHMVAWKYAYREARKGHWEQYARDRSHFRRRIENLSSIIEPILRKKLAEMM